MIKKAAEKGFNKFEWIHKKSTGENFYPEDMNALFDQRETIQQRVEAFLV